MKVARALLLLALGFSAACQSPRDVPFEIRFANDSTLSSASLVRVEIREGTCSGRVLWSDSISLNGGNRVGMSMPPVFGAGEYAIDIEARDAECNVVAEACDVRQLPQDEGGLTVTLADETRQACPLMQCTEGVCDTDTPPDAGPPDTGPEVDCNDDDECPSGTCRNSVCCNQCWDGSACQAGTSTSACGSGGAMCAQCDSGESCVSGRCERDIGPVDPALSLSIDTSYVAINGVLYSAGDSGDDFQRGALVSSTPNVFARQDTELRFRRVAAMETTACGITTEGHLYCWGSNIAGLRGQGSGAADPNAEPQRVGLDAWKEIDAGNQHFCAIRSDDHLLCWGNNANVRAGFAGGGVRLSPTDIDPSATWMAVSAGDTHSCAVRTTGELYCWGTGGDGRLGLSDMVTDIAPTQVGVGSDWTAVTAGAEHSCGIRGGDLYCWGPQTFDRLGTGTDTGQADTPALVDDTRTWLSVSAGQYHTCGLVDSSEVLCWGLSREGETGQGMSGQTSVPTRVTDGFRLVDVSWQHSCGVREEGQSEVVVCWGTGMLGRLGTGDGDPRQSPTEALFSPPLD